jgi:hypothetical protein
MQRNAPPDGASLWLLALGGCVGWVSPESGVYNLLPSRLDPAKQHPNAPVYASDVSPTGRSDGSAGAGLGVRAAATVRRAAGCGAG